MKQLLKVVTGLMFVGSFAPLCADAMHDEFDMAANVLISQPVDPNIMLQWSKEERSLMRSILLSKRDGVAEESMSESQTRWISGAQKVALVAFLAAAAATVYTAREFSGNQNAYDVGTRLGFSKDVLDKVYAQMWSWAGYTALSMTGLLTTGFCAGYLANKLQESEAVAAVDQRVDELVGFIDMVDNNV